MTKFLQTMKQWAPVIVIALVIFFPMVANAVPQALPDVGLDEGQVIGVIQRVTNFLIGIGAILAIFWVVIAGIRYVFAGGSSEKAGDARTMLFNGLIGLAIIVGAYLI